MLPAAALVAATPLKPRRASDKARREGKELIEDAHKKSNIFEISSFEMKANIRIENRGKSLDGSYMLLWNGPEQWREEISLPGYSEIKVGSKGMVSLKRSTDSIPLQIERLHRTLSYGRAGVTPDPEETIKKTHDRSVNGVKGECVEIADQERNTREVCVEGSTGALVRQSPFLDKELQPIGSKLFPRFLSYVENGKPLAEVQVTDLKTTEKLPLSAFEPPVGGVSQRGCINPNPGHLVKRVRPSFPVSERRYEVAGTIALYGVIATDGVLRDLRIVSGLSPGLNRSSLDAVQQWRYEPFTCDGVAVAVETVVLVNYSLEQ